MAFEFKLPDIGEGVVEGEIVEWLVKEGDEVAEDQPLVAVMTDKATVEIPSPRKGKVARLGAKAGEIVKVGAVLVTLDADGETAAPKAAEGKQAEGKQPEGKQAEGKAPEPKAPAGRTGDARPAEPKAADAPKAVEPPRPAHAPSKEEAEEAAAPRRGESRPAAAPAPKDEPSGRDADDDGAIVASPATRKLAREKGVDLSAVRGSGPRGRVTREDVEAAAQAPRARLAPSGSEAAPAKAPESKDAPAAKAPSGRAEAPLLAIPRGAGPGAREETREPVRGLRKKIAERMLESKRNAPHFAYVDHFDATELVALRNRLKPQAERYGVSLTYMPFILKALVPCLKEFPIVNSTMDDASGELVYKHYYNIGVAADTDRGLTVPVVHDVDRKSVLEIAAEIVELVERARAGRSRLEDLQGGTFTVTSTGNIGGLFATPIINHPEVAILGVPKIKKLPWVVEDQVVVRDVLHVALCFNHRVVDGAVGARFTNRLIEYLAEPSRLFLEMA